MGPETEIAERQETLLQDTFPTDEHMDRVLRTVTCHTLMRQENASEGGRERRSMSVNELKLSNMGGSELLNPRTKEICSWDNTGERA